MNVCIVGLGLLGGSFSLALRKAHSDIHVKGVDINEQNSNKAVELGIADEIVSFEEGVSTSELIVLATPGNVLARQIIQALDLMSVDAILTDLGSTKETLANIVDDHPRRKRYVAAHPMAGTENSGPEAAFASLMHHKMMIICDQEKSDPEVVEKFEGLLKSIDMKIAHMKSKDHDRHIAFVSHLSHITSFVLGATVLDKEKDERSIFAMAGSGFSSTVRLAKSSPDMWAPIFSQNRENVLTALEAYINKLEYFKQIIINDDVQASYELMHHANEIRRVLQGISKHESDL
jgi:prephenate dehydrogenase